MSGSKPGSRPGARPTDDSDNDLAARIGASLAPDRPARPIAARPVGKPINHLARPSSAESEIDETQLPEALEETEAAAPPRDLFWPVLGVISMLALTGSFLMFMVISRVPETRENPLVRASATASPEVSFEGQGTRMIGDYKFETETPSPSPSATPTQTAITRTEVEPVEASVAPPPILPAATLPPPGPAVRLTPPPIRAVTPPSIKPPPAKTPPPVESSDYLVLAGPYDNRADAEAGSSVLGELGQAVKINENDGKFWLQVGSSFAQQDEALALAEQVIQRGHQAMVKKKQ